MMAVAAYDVFGFRLRADRALPLPQAPAPAAQADLHFTSGPDAASQIPAEQEATTLLARPSFVLQGCEQAYILRLRNRSTGRPVAAFSIRAAHIHAQILDAAYDSMLPVWLLGNVIALWLEQRGLPVLHGSAARVGDQAAAFVSHSRAGKSGLAAACMQAGHALLTDDLLAIETTQCGMYARPGYPLIRMWPDAATHFLGEIAPLHRVQPRTEKRRVPVGSGGFGTFCGTPLPLARLYLPRRFDEARAADGISIRPLRGSAALVELLRFVYTGPYLKDPAVRIRHLRVLGNLAARVPIRQLDYPAGFHHLPAVYHAIRRDLAD